MPSFHQDFQLIRPVDDVVVRNDIGKIVLDLIDDATALTRCLQSLPFVVSEEFCGKSNPNMFVFPACILMMETTASCTFSTAAVVSVVTLTATSVTVSFTVVVPVSPVPDPLPEDAHPEKQAGADQGYHPASDQSADNAVPDR